MLDIDLLVESDGIYMTTLPEGQSFTWRLLSIKEHRVFSTLRDQGIYSEYQLYDKVFDRCYVGDARAINGNLPAGIFLSIGRLIMYLSGDCAGEEAQEIEAARSTYHQAGVLEIIRRVILMAFPYKPEELECWTRRKLLAIFVEAEALLQNRGEYQPLDTSKIMTAEEMAKKQSKPLFDFQKDNSEINKEFGDGNHPLDLHPTELEARAKKTQKLNAEQLKIASKSLQSEEKAVRQARRRI